MFRRGCEQTGLAQLLRKWRFHFFNRRGKCELVQLAAREVDDEDLSVGSLSKLHRSQLDVAQFEIRGDGLLLRIPLQCPDLARVVVTVNVVTSQFRQPRAVINEAAGDRSKIVMRVLDDRLDEFARTFGPLRPERVPAFPDTPAVIAAALDDVNHLPQVLPDFAGPHRSVGRVPAELPDLAMTVRPDFRASICDADERVVFGNGVRQVAGLMINVQPEDRAKQVADVLSGFPLIRDAAAIAGCQIQKPIRAKPKTAAVVTTVRPLDQNPLRSRIRRHL